MMQNDFQNTPINIVCWQPCTLLQFIDKWFEPSSINNCLSSVIIWMRVVLRKTAVGEWCFHYLSLSYLDYCLTTAEVVKMSVTNNLSEDYSHPNNHARQTFLELFIALEFQVSFQENSQFSCSQPYRNITHKSLCLQWKYYRRVHVPTWNMHKAYLEVWKVLSPHLVFFLLFVCLRSLFC